MKERDKENKKRQRVRKTKEGKKEMEACSWKLR